MVGAEAEEEEEVEEAEEAEPRDPWLFVDDQTRYILGYYLAKNDSSLPTPWQVECVKASRSAPMLEVLGGYRVITPRKSVFSFTTDETIRQMNEAARILDVPPGDRWWIVSADGKVLRSLHNFRPEAISNAKEFGKISVVKATWAIKARWPVAGF